MRRLNIIIFFIMISVFALSAQNSGKPVKLNAAEKKIMDTFFSNYSEVFMKPFTKDSLTDIDLIQFGVFHNYKNNEKLFVKTGKENMLKIKADHIAESVNKFFSGKIRKHQSIEGVEYKDGWYFVPEASGETFKFSQIADIYDNGNNIFTATVNVYSAGSGWTGNVHGTAEEWGKISSDDEPELTDVMKATLQRVIEKGKSRYILIEYTKIK